MNDQDYDYQKLISLVENYDNGGIRETDIQYIEIGSKTTIVTARTDMYGEDREVEINIDNSLFFY